MWHKQTKKHSGTHALTRTPAADVLRSLSPPCTHIPFQCFPLFSVQERKRERKASFSLFFRSSVFCGNYTSHFSVCAQAPRGRKKGKRLDPPLKNKKTVWGSIRVGLDKNKPISQIVQIKSAQGVTEIINQARTRLCEKARQTLSGLECCDDRKCFRSHKLEWEELVRLDINRRSMSKR